MNTKLGKTVYGELIDKYRLLQQMVIRLTQRKIDECIQLCKIVHVQDLQIYVIIRKQNFTQTKIDNKVYNNMNFVNQS